MIMKKLFLFPYQSSMWDVEDHCQNWKKWTPKLFSTGSCWIKYQFHFVNYFLSILHQSRVLTDKFCICVFHTNRRYFFSSIRERSYHFTIFPNILWPKTLAACAQLISRWSIGIYRNNDLFLNNFCIKLILLSTYLNHATRWWVP